MFCDSPRPFVFMQYDGRNPLDGDYRLSAFSGPLWRLLLLLAWRICLFSMGRKESLLVSDPVTHPFCSDWWDTYDGLDRPVREGGNGSTAHKVFLSLKSHIRDSRKSDLGGRGFFLSMYIKHDPSVMLALLGTV